MQDMQISEEEPPGLRERKRQRTRETIARVALELFDRQGFQETTIAQIAEAADVSPRTVSGYFPHKEDLAFPDVEADLAAFDARLHERLPGETAIDALREFIRSMLEKGEPPRASAGPVSGSSTPTRACACTSTTHGRGCRRCIAAAIARDLGASADDLEPRMAAAATLTVFELLGGDEDDGDPAEALAAIDRALLFIGGGISALR